MKITSPNSATRTTPTDSPAGFSYLNPSLATQASNTIQAIKDFIIQSHLQPGDPLPTETQLCADLRVSRSSVREAMRTLSALDIVEVRHGHGTFVGSVSMRPIVESLVFRGLLKPGDDYRSLREVVQVRQTLDLAMAESVVNLWKGRSDEPLNQAVAQMEKLAAQGKTFIDDDRFFHSRLLSALDNQLYRHLVDAFWAVHTLTVPLLDAPSPKEIEVTAKAHRSMLQAAHAGDIEAYRHAVIAHYEPLLRVLHTA